MKSVTAVKPNRNEAFRPGLPSTGAASGDERQTALKAGEILLEMADQTARLPWRTGHDAFERGSRIISRRSEAGVPCSGAGDTAIALFTLALSCRATPVEAAEIANHACAVVVGKVGTATVTPEELRASFQNDRLA
jgi:D-beta-D-heptose 7-phosphate kinase/D-beta-D-heptose 1-phosphate adenosyltransferase